MVAEKTGNKWPKTRPVYPVPQQVFLNLVRAYEQAINGLNQLCKQNNISPFQYNVLRILRGAGPAGLPSLSIAERMINRVPDITRLIDRLEAAGLVQRVRSEHDRRVVMAQLTPKALALLAAMDEPLVKLHERQFANLTDVEQEQLNYLLLKVQQGDLE